MTEVADAKRALRAAMRVRRDALPDGQSRAAGLALLEHAPSVPLPDGPVAGFWPLGRELDVRPLLGHLKTSGRTVALPATGPKGQPLTFREWREADALALGRHGVAEPSPDRAEVVPAVVLVPLLAFDRRGGRLGFGGGYYDRTLAALRAAGPVLAVGVGYAWQAVDAVPRDGHDQMMDWLLTDRGAFRAERSEDG